MTAMIKPRHVAHSAKPGRIRMPQNRGVPSEFRRSRFVGNIVLRVTSYDLSAMKDGCFPGVASGVVAGGALDERRIDIAIRSTATNSRVPRISNFAEPKSISHTVSGGFIAFENVRERDGNFRAAWANRFAGPDDVLRAGLPIRIAPVFNSSGDVRVNRGTGAALYGSWILHPQESETACSGRDLLGCATAVFENRNAAMLAMVSGGDPSSDNFERRTLTLRKGTNGGLSAPAGESAAAALSKLEHLDFDAAFENGAVCDIIPMECLRVGVKASESIDQGAKHAIALKSYRTGGLGRRIGLALSEVDPKVGAKLERAFLDEAQRSARIAFSKHGWRGVQSMDVRTFFRAKGIELPRADGFGFAISTALLKPCGNDKQSIDELFVAKSRALSSALPPQAIPSASDPDADNRSNRLFAALIDRAAAAARVEFNAIDEGIAGQKTNYPSPANSLLGAQRPSASAGDSFNAAADEAEPSGANMDI